MRRGGGGVEWAVLDVTDAFKMVHLHTSEQKSVAFAIGDAWYAYKGLPFGARASPLVWGRVAALLSRSTQALFGPGEARLCMYVDDPLLGVKGTKASRERCMAIAIL